MKFLFIPCAALLFCYTARAAEPVYPEPHTQQSVFDVSRLKCSRTVRSQMASMLAACVQSHGTRRSQEDLNLYAHALGLALQLDAFNRDAIVTNARLKRNEAPPPPKKAVSRAQAAASLQRLAKSLHSTNNAEDIKLASYVISLGRQLDPANDDLLYETELLKKNQVLPDWSFVTGVVQPGAVRAIHAPEIYKGINLDYQNTPKAFARRQQSIKSLMIAHGPSGRMVGTVMDAILTVEPPRDLNNNLIQFARPVGQEMVVSCNEAVRTVRVRYPEWEDGIIRVSFSDKYSSKDGGSAGGAFTLALLGLLDGIEYEEGFVMTGEVTVDWKLRRVGGVPEKIRAGMVDRMRLIAVPKENEADVVNLAVLYSPKALWDTQIFSIDSVVDAVRIGRVDKPRKTAEAIARFARLQPRLNAHPKIDTLTQANIRKGLSEVLELEPNHLSARLLLMVGEGRLPKHMSFMASIEHLFLGLGPLTPDIFSQHVIRDLPLIGSEFEQTLRELEQAQSKVHPKTLPLQKSMMHFSRASYEMSRVSKASIGPSEKRNRFDRLYREREKARRAIHEYINALSNNQPFLEKLMNY